ncbi:hypothetical protein PFISCL1PPCAC_22762, partial [Pristionchus fissidentatus]
INYSNLVMAAWGTYITRITGRSEACAAVKRIAFVDCSSGAFLSHTDEFIASADELAALVKCFDNLDQVPSTGVILERIHFQATTTTEGLIYGLKGRTAFFANKTKTAVLVAIYEVDTTDESEVRTAVEQLANYVMSIGG